MKLALVAETAKKQGITEELKVRDQMAWVGRMNNIDSSVEEFMGSAAERSPGTSRKLSLIHI